MKPTVGFYISKKKLPARGSPFLDALLMVLGWVMSQLRISYQGLYDLLVNQISDAKTA